jgi:pimeloyl-ACP methyl ester carboxylesterase
VRAYLGADGSDEYFRGLYPNLTIATLPDAGHMLHHEQPEDLAALIEPFFAA